MKSKDLIDYFPSILEEAPEFIRVLQRYNGWKKNRLPTDVIANWEKEDRNTKFYFLGWLKESTKNFGVAGMIPHFTLHQKQAVARYIEAILEEANREENDSFYRGMNERVDEKFGRR